MRGVVLSVKIPMMNSLTNILSLMKMKTVVFATFYLETKVQTWDFEADYWLSCHVSPRWSLTCLWWRTAITCIERLCRGVRRGKREESCGESGEREDAAAAMWRTVEWLCVKRGRWRTAVHSPALATRGAQPYTPTVAKWRCFKVSFNSKMASWTRQGTSPGLVRIQGVSWA